MDVLVAYDIDTTSPAGERRLAQVAKACEGFGIRVQYSVFECRLSAAGLERMRAHLGALIDPGLDSVRIYRFQGAVEDSSEVIGNGRQWRAGSPWVV